MKLLVVGQLPPPFHGQAVVNELVFDADWQSFEKVVLPMRYSRTIDDVGSAGLSKVLHLIYLIFSTWKIWLLEHPDAIYYPPASANRVPVLRDVVYLGMTRFLFKKTVFHFHAGGLGQYLDSIGMVGAIAKWVYRRPDLAIELYKEPDSPGRYLKARDVVVVPNGLSVEEPVASLDSEEKFTVMFMGSLREDKGVLDVLRTIAELKKQGVGVKMLLAGAWISKEFESEAKKMVATLEISAEVEWLGIVTGKEKWNALRGSHCFFFPTFYHSEKFPLVLIEALGMGLPVVSTNWRGIPQLLDGVGDTVRLSEVGEINQFAKSLAKFAGDRCELTKLGSLAREHYENNYTKDKFLESMESHLFNLLQEK